MAPKTARFVLLVAAFVAGLAGVFAVLFVVTGSHMGAAAIGGPFQLIDQNGRPFTDADLKGRPFLVFFGFTHCPDACPTTMNQPAFVELGESRGDTDRDAKKASEFHRLSWPAGRAARRRTVIAQLEDSGVVERACPSG